MSLRFFLILLIFVPVLASAAPWAKVGDAQLRSAVDWLADRGCLVAPVTSWPVMWADIRLTDGASQACADSQAWRYVSFERAWAQDTATGEVDLAGANQAPLFRGFADQPREKSRVGLVAEAHSKRFAGGLSVSYVPNPFGLEHTTHNQTRFDGSYLAATFGNWVVGAGAISRWWGPGHSNSLLLSSNARPVPGVFLSRLRATPIDFPVLNWLGPVTFTAFAGELESERQVPHAKLLGMRMAFKPTQWLEIGASRSAQWGGNGRTQSWSTLKDVLIGRDNYHHDSLQEPGNQLAGFDFRIGVPLGDTSTLSFYGQATGEDEAKGLGGIPLPSKNVGMFGLGMSGNWFSGRQQLWLEYTDTMVDDLAHDPKPNVLYEHHIYVNGYRYYGRSLGSTWDSDSEVASLGVKQFFNNGVVVGLQVDHVKLNKDAHGGAGTFQKPSPVIAVPSGENFTLTRLVYQQPLLDGRLSVSAAWNDQPLETLNKSYDGITLMASWEYRFAL